MTSRLPAYEFSWKFSDLDSAAGLACNTVEFSEASVFSVINSESFRNPQALLGIAFLFGIFSLAVDWRANPRDTPRTRYSTTPISGGRVNWHRKAGRAVTGRRYCGAPLNCSQWIRPRSTGEAWQLRSEVWAVLSPWHFIFYTFVLGTCSSDRGSTRTIISIISSSMRDRNSKLLEFVEPVYRTVLHRFLSNVQKLDSIRKVYSGTRKGLRDGHMAVMGTGILIFPSASTNRNIPHRPTSRPIPLAVLAEVAGLVNIVIVEITELSLHAITARTRKYLVWCSSSSPPPPSSAGSFPEPEPCRAELSSPGASSGQEPSVAGAVEAGISGSWIVFPNSFIAGASQGSGLGRVRELHLINPEMGDATSAWKSEP
nr:hypothetical protein TorRG33x02_105600 [Ipomoea batatas]